MACGTAENLACIAIGVTQVPPVSTSPRAPAMISQGSVLGIYHCACRHGLLRRLTLQVPASITMAVSMPISPILPQPTEPGTVVKSQVHLTVLCQGPKRLGIGHGLQDH